MTDTALPAPLVPPHIDLRGYEFMPFFGDALDRSTFDETENDTAWRFGVKLWWEAWAKQVPAASLPDDDGKLAKACGLGRDVTTFRKIRAEALHGFVKCSDGRLYHRFLAPHAISAWNGRLKQQLQTANGRIVALQKRLLKALSQDEKLHLESLIQELQESISLARLLPVTDKLRPDKLPLSQPPVFGLLQKPQGQGQRQLEGQDESPPNRPPTGANSAPPPSLPEGLAGEACKAIREARMHPVNPSDPDLLDLLAQGVTPEQLGNLAAELFAQHGVKPMRYVLKAMRGRLEEAAARPKASRRPDDFVGNDYSDVKL